MDTHHIRTNDNHCAEGLVKCQILHSRHTKADRNSAYSVYMTTNTVETCCNVLTEVIGPQSALVVTTPTVARLYAKKLYEQLRLHNDRTSYIELHCDEATKSIDQVLRVCERAFEVGLDRTGLLIAIGGGVCTDIVTVAASWIRRGIGHIRVPTTLIGQIDAGIGIKGAVNFCGKKSSLGCFYPPQAAVITPTFLQTLPHQHLRAGFAEIIKMAVVRDQHLFELVEGYAQELLASGFTQPEGAAQEILWHSIVRMLEELEPNIYEDRTYKRLVDFGHTFSPALEAVSEFSLSHGEAVAIDIALSAVLANQLGLLSSEVSVRLLTLLLDVGLPVWSPLLTADLCQRGLREMTLHRGGQPNLVVPIGIGEAIVLETPDLLHAPMEKAIQTLQGMPLRCT